MPVYRYQGVNDRNRPVQGTISCDSARDARRRADEIAQGRDFRVTGIQRRRTYLYRARRGSDHVVQGEERAFATEDVEGALVRAGYRVLSVRPRVLDSFSRASSKDVVMFMRLSADLLQEKLPYDEILLLLQNDLPSRPLRMAIREIYQDLKDGRSGHEVFDKHRDLFGKFPAYMLGIASTSGNMVEIYMAAAKFLERNAEFKKSLRSALIMPAAVMVALLGVVVFYVGYIFPKTAELFVRFKMDLPPMTSATMELSYFLRQNMSWILLASVALVVCLAQLWKSERCRLAVDRWIVRIPLLGPLLHKTSIEIFCRVFHAIYSGSGDNIEVIRIAAEACQNRHLEKRIKDEVLPRMIRDGKGFVEALDQSGVFTATAISRLRSGAETGNIRSTALQLANYYEAETTYRLKAIIDYIQIAIAVLIMLVMTAITLVSSETAIIKPNPPGTLR